MKERREEVQRKSNNAPASNAGQGTSLQKVMASADHYNRAHPAEVQKFNNATQNSCGSGETVSVQQVMSWQKSNGLRADGKIGPGTVQKAEEAAPDVGFTEEEAGDVGDPRADSKKSSHASMDSAKASNLDEPDSLAGQTASQGASDVGLEKEDGHEKMEEASEVAHEGLEKTGEALELGEHAGAHGETGMKVVAGLAVLPYVISLIKEKKYKKAVETVVGLVGWDERVHLIKLACERAGVSGPLIHLLEKAVIVGELVDVLLLGWLWVSGSFKALHAAKEKGEAESLLGIYAYAWAQTIVEGRHSNPGAVTASQLEAKEKGVAEGEATRAAQPELAFLLIAEYGSEDNARKALEDSLYQREGIGVKTHEGK